eukprot:176081_1
MSTLSCSTCGGTGKITKKVVTHLITCPCCHGLSYGCKCGKKGCRYQMCSRGEIYSSNSSNAEFRRIDCNKCNGSGAAFKPKYNPNYNPNSYCTDSSDDDDYYDQFETEYEKKKKKEQETKKRRQKLIHIQKQKELELKRKEKKEFEKALALSMSVNHRPPDKDLERALKDSVNEETQYKHYMKLEESMNNLNIDIDCIKPKHYTNEVKEEPLMDLNLNDNKLSNNEEISNNSCSICLQEYKYDDKKLVLRCMHVFHDVCAGQWIKQMKNRRCPICRTPVDA